MKPNPSHPVRNALFRLLAAGEILFGLYVAATTMTDRPSRRFIEALDMIETRHLDVGKSDFPKEKQLLAAAQSLGRDIPDRAAAIAVIDAADRPDQDKLAIKAIGEMLHQVDPYSGILEDRRTAAMEPGASHSEIGVNAYWREGKLSIYRVIPGSIAEATGFHVNDEIVEIDDRPVTNELWSEQAICNGTAHAMAVLRDETRVVLPSIACAITQPGWAHVARAGAVEFLTVSMFGDGLAAEAKLKLADSRKRFGPPKAIILDLRENPGGRIDEAAKLSGLFLRPGTPIVQIKNVDESSQALGAEHDPDFNDITTPMAVLIRRTSASAAEIVAAGLKDRGRAFLVGDRTHGKGVGMTPLEIPTLLQQPLSLRPRYGLVLVDIEDFHTDGRRIQSTGIAPDLTIPDGIPPEVAPRAEDLKTAASFSFQSPVDPSSVTFTRATDCIARTEATRYASDPGQDPQMDAALCLLRTPA